MFLDDQIVARVKNNYPKNRQAELNLINSVVQQCMKKIKAELEGEVNPKARISKVKKFINIWNSAAQKLGEEGYPLFRRGGLEQYIKKELPEFKNILS